MNDASRRGFLAIAGTGVAVAGVAAVMPSADAAAPPATAPDLDGPVVAVVRDVRTGEVSVLHGDREETVHDHALVARLTAALG
ncbi:MAG: hypothetical protein ABJA87_07475 [bacterium]